MTDNKEKKSSKLIYEISDYADKIRVFSLDETVSDITDSFIPEKYKGDTFGTVLVRLIAEKGISAKLFKNLYKKNITLVTRLKKNMKNKLVNYYDMLTLRKRSVIESVNDFLKNICQIKHSRHRSATNFLVNLLSGLAAYSFLPKKPSVFSDDNEMSGILCLFD